jgi:predicted nucleic acid-binding Zn ribbon protein
MATSEKTPNRHCELCSKPFYYPPGSSHPGKYCGYICRNGAMRTVPWSTCVTCGQPVRKKKYCGRECYYDSLKGKPSPRKNRANCTVCGVEVGKGSKEYCSRECYLTVHTANNTTPELELLRNSAEYRRWRTAVFERDDYTCQGCGIRGNELHADHIKSFAHHPELRFDLTNGRTLCVPCHRATPNYGFKARLVDATGY